MPTLRAGRSRFFLVPLAAIWIVLGGVLLTVMTSGTADTAASYDSDGDNNRDDGNDDEDDEDREDQDREDQDHEDKDRDDKDREDKDRSSSIKADVTASEALPDPTEVPSELAFGDKPEPTSTTEEGTTRPETTRNRPTPDDGEVLVASVIGEGIYAFAGPTGTEATDWFPNPTQFGGPRVFLVDDAASYPEWVKVSLPVMPNGQFGWVRRDEVTIDRVAYRAQVDLSDRSVSVWADGELVLETGAVIGSAATPTPIGQFYVRDIIAKANSGGAYGPYVLALSGFSEALDSFAGGLPAIAIHGTNNPQLIGQRRSNGCIRIHNDQIRILADSVPLGTPVDIVA